MFVLGTYLRNSLLKVLFSYKLTFLFSLYCVVLDSSINRNFAAFVIINNTFRFLFPVFIFALSYI